jgi:hypothetical protein
MTMALEAAFSDLATQLRALQESLIDLRLAAVEEKPARGDLVLVDLYGDGADELIGSIEEALQSAEGGYRSALPPVDLDRARRELTACHESYIRLSRRFKDDLTRYERVADLAGIGRRRGRAWGLWAFNVKSGLDRCQQPLFDVDEALLACWREIGERVGMTSVSVQATNIGQVMTSESMAADSARPLGDVPLATAER